MHSQNEVNGVTVLQKLEQQFLAHMEYCKSILNANNSSETELRMLRKALDSLINEHESAIRQFPSLSFSNDQHSRTLFDASIDHLHSLLAIQRRLNQFDLPKLNVGPRGP